MRTDEYHGLEFDWVAADISGQLAIFCSAGYGPVPAKALRAAGDQEALLGLIGIQAGLSGQSDFLTSRCHRAIYCFDWKLFEGPYRLKQEPAPEKGMGIDTLPERLRDSVTRLDLSFIGRELIHAAERGGI
ncbi:hypothetical protein OJ996_24205 [Luteolibacter sp. GHJ8]|uniref:Uncharacterized protein n=1 Tax=Luteolibacter rhizosphaerae TaxID=2989719 RepID=A0ABT3GAP2_9BACT|nr:hypothetical protein [Luteolibacter rhizosphaerae]MCW1916712.1 hypothetical protein [Luteolibacter rhizosphaerae]